MDQSNEPQQRKRVTTACSACKLRRSKCDGEVPCSRCRYHDTKCQKDENDDRRRNLALKRKLQEADADRHLLDSLINALRIAQPQQIDSLITLLRSHAARKDVQAYLDESLGDLDNDMQLDTTTTTGGSESPAPSPRKHRHRTGRVQDLVNPPLSVPAKPWTTVTDDDDFVSHLMSLWFTWAQPWWHWVDEDLFLEAMKSGDTNSPFCTPYLVNMILADACLLDYMGPDETEPNAALRDQFYAEGKKLLEAESGKVSLALVQAVGVQWTYLNTNGQDKIGNPILNQQIFMAKDLDKWQARLEKEGKLSHEILMKVEQSLDRLSWVLYILNSFSLMSFPKSTAMSVPNRKKPAFTHSSTYQGNWMPYPKNRNVQIPFHPDCHFATLLSLAEKACKEEAIYYRQDEEDWEKHMEHFLQIYDELQRWSDTIPACMKLTEDAMPHVLALHAVYHWVMITLTKQAAAAYAGKAGKPTIATTPESRSREYWQSAAATSAITIGKLMQSQCDNWGVDHFPVIIIQPVTLSLLTLLESLDPNENKPAFVSLCIAMRAASRRFRVAQGVLQLVTQTAGRHGIRLPEETEHLLRWPSAETETGQISIHSEDDIGMDYLLDKWEDMDI